ncbi:MAG TPA: hypothetical protein P5234_08150 [Thermoanaerobaculaceae bacterium]|nr:hypothetical protein [Thermoanaerobaculaceae bacterium]HRS16210.1 hypothetical protein [Thermoanaerobaculaceae bacterium]
MRAVLTCVALLAAAAALAGGPVDKAVPFELGTWVALEHTEGPVVLHRIRVVEQTGTITKSTIFRPVGSEYLKTVQIQLEYSNSATRDWECFLHVEWLDADGKVIDGYRDSESLDDREVHDAATVTLSTLKYGLERARTLKIRLEVHP